MTAAARPTRITDLDFVLTRNSSDGRVHKRYELAGRLIVEDICARTADDRYEVIAHVDASVPLEAMCWRCFPEEHAPIEDDL